QVGPRIWTGGEHFGGAVSAESAQQRVWCCVLRAADCAGVCGAGGGCGHTAGDLAGVHRWLTVPGLHPLLHPGGLLCHLCHHLCLELHPPATQCQEAAMFDGKHVEEEEEEQEEEKLMTTPTTFPALYHQQDTGRERRAAGLGGSPRQCYFSVL
ncbi:hypothetical protein GDO78_021030, partial [Eleutherodactylus coqui]